MAVTFAVLPMAGIAQSFVTHGAGCSGKLRGFAFAGFMCRAHAEKAIKLCNGQVSNCRPPYWMACDEKFVKVSNGSLAASRHWLDVLWQ